MNKRRLCEDYFKKHYPNLYSYLIENYKNTTSDKFSEKLYLFVNKISVPPRCPICGGPVKYLAFNIGYQKYCSGKCSNNCPEVKLKKRKKHIAVFNIDEISIKEPFEIPDLIMPNGKIMRYDYIACKYPEFYVYIDSLFKEYMIPWTEKLYLYLNNMKEPGKCQFCGKFTKFRGFNKGYNKYCSRKCGVIDNLEVSKHKREHTFLNKYGTASPFSSKEVQEKIRKTNLEKFGAENPMHSDEVKEKLKQTNLEKFGVENVFASEEIKDKIKKTNKERYGTEYATQCPKVKEKTKQTNLKNLGVEYPMQSQEVRETTRQNNLKKYGVEWTTQTNEMKEKTKRTNLKNLGVEWPMQSQTVQEKSKHTCLNKFGVENPMKLSEIREKSKQTNLKNLGVEWPMQSQTIREKSKNTCLEKFGVDNVSKSPEIQKKKEETYLKHFGVPYGVLITEPFSNEPNKIETKVIDYLRELGEKALFGVWNLIENELNYPLQLDIFLEERKIAFEINGSYWHSLENPSTSKNQHIQKHILCQEKGIELIYLWEDWIDRDWNSVKDFIKAKLKNDWKTIDKYKRKWFPELHDREWPLDLGLPQNFLMNNFENEHIKEHMCTHGNKICYDSGIILITT